MLDILEWTLDILGLAYKRLDGRYMPLHVVKKLLVEINYLQSSYFFLLNN